MESKPKMIVAKDAGAAGKAAAAEFAKAVKAALEEMGKATIAISGGSTPRPMHRILARPPHRTNLDWKKIHLYWVDERLVPYYDADSNFGNACEDLIDPLQLDSNQVHPVPVSGNPAVLADDYQNALRAHFQPTGDQPPVFDLICLGVGKDGHTASLFPGHPALNERKRWSIAVKGGKPGVDRITLSLPVINAARRVLIVVTGASKAEAVYTAMSSPEADLPVQRVQPASGNVTWVLDREALSRIHKVIA